ncbi:unnamed protein product [Pylaiella littoralis]
MSLKSRKFKISITSILPYNATELYNELSKKHTMKYVCIYTDDDEHISVYANFNNAVVDSRIRLFMKGMDIDTGEISTYKQFEGNLQSEHGKLFSIGRPRKRGREIPPANTVINDNSTTINNNNIDNSTTNNNNINLIIVNPIGSESLDHITPEFIQELLAEHNGPDVVFRFGTKMYSLTENMNFKTDVKSGYISGRVERDGSWATHRKNEGFSMLMDNLKDKNEQAVLKYLDTIPNNDLDKFALDMGWIREHKISGLQEDEPVYNKFIREGFNLLTANIADKKRRIERDTGKKLKLV